MRFDLDHDWQGSISTPGAKMGERAKTHLLVVLCGIWLVFGLIGHSPWKPFESESISIIKAMIENGEWLAPLAASQSLLQDPPLYYAAASLFSTLTSPLLSMHDAARLSSGLWMLLTLILIGRTGREMWGKGFGRQTVFIFIGSLGLILSAHTITPHVSSLTGLAASFYGFSLLRRRPYRAAILIGIGAGISFLSKGLIPLLIVATTALLLGIAFSKQWQSRQLTIVSTIATSIASLFLLAWLVPMQLHQPEALYMWWQHQFSQLNFANHQYLYFLKTIFWFCWPATPLAIWGFWRYRHELLNSPNHQLITIFFVVSFFFIGLSSHHTKDIYALPILIPLTLLAGGSIETLKRGAAAALNWFGLTLYGLIIGLIWLGWFAMKTGKPEKLHERLSYLSGLDDLPSNWFYLAIAVFVTLIWLLAIFRSQHSNRAAATNWAIGMTAIWTLLMTLWLPMIESARTYEPVLTALKARLDASGVKQEDSCINSYGLGLAQRDFVDYFADIKTIPVKAVDNATCDLYLIQDSKKQAKIDVGNKWTLVFEGSRIHNDRRESFRLLHRPKPY